MPPDYDPGMDPDQDPGVAGTPTPAELEAVRADNERLKQENAKLREERRVERAERLGAEHGLSPTQVELLQLLPADQMEEKAKALVAERGTPASPAEVVEPAEPVADPTLESFDRLPGGDAPEPRGFQAELRERINKAGSLEEINAIQREMREKQRAATRAAQQA